MAIIPETPCRADAQKKPHSYGMQPFTVAEREGFEPPEPFSSTVFKTAVIDHSTTSPEMDCKGNHFMEIRKKLKGCLAFFLKKQYDYPQKHP